VKPSGEGEDAAHRRAHLADPTVNKARPDKEEAGMAKEVTIRTSTGNEVTGKFVREDRHQVSASDTLGIVGSLGMWGSTLKGNRTTVVTKNGDYVTGQRIR
jgi:hypothetical protein